MVQDEMRSNSNLRSDRMVKPKMEKCILLQRGRDLIKRIACSDFHLKMWLLDASGELTVRQQGRKEGEHFRCDTHSMSK
jgi:hypothetical protein